jgi:hypothetical protein
MSRTMLPLLPLLCFIALPMPITGRFILGIMFIFRSRSRFFVFRYVVVGLDFARECVRRDYNDDSFN